eukprot:COSAG01_NODE_59884_length_297_cov_2.136364_1_plen_46_part_10
MHHLTAENNVKHKENLEQIGCAGLTDRISNPGVWAVCRVLRGVVWV